MKKLFAILAVATFVFAACGQKKAETTEPVVEATEIEVVEEIPVDEVAAEISEEVVETPAE